MAIVETAYMSLMPALTALERLEAARNMGGSDIMRQRWFIVSGLVAIAVLSIIFFVVTYRRKVQAGQISEAAFYNGVAKAGLNTDECRILRKIAARAGLTRPEAIFTMEQAFSVGASLIIEESILSGGASSAANLRRDIASMRQKLGFFDRTSYAMKMKKLSSRQIPVGKKLHITRRINPDRESTDIECTLVRNDQMELTLRLPLRIDTAAGEFWRVYYHLGASVWEFDATVLDYDGYELSLSHSDEIRYINRRRFLRVPVRKQGFIATFPYQKTHRKMVAKDQDQPCERTGFGEVADWGLPRFTPAVITELAGPGLRIEASIQVKVQDRVLVVFKLDESPVKSKTGSHGEQLIDVKLVEEIGQVRHTQPAGQGLSIAVELTSVTDAAVNELIRATNAEAVKAHGRHQQTTSDDESVQAVVAHAAGGEDV